MTSNEVTQLFELFIAEYEKFEFSKEKIILWSTMLADVPYNVVKVAAMALIAKSPYPPKLADITAKIAEVTTPKNQKITGSEAWGEVQKAMRIYGRHRETELMKSLTPLTKIVVTQFGLHDLMNGELDKIGVAKGQFLKMFEQYTNRIREEKLIPNTLQKTINQLAEKYGGLALKAGDGIEE